MNFLAENTILLKALPKNKNRTVIFRICQVLAEKNGTCFQNQKQFKQFKEIMEFFLFFILNAVKTTKKNSAKLRVDFYLSSFVSLCDSLNAI